MSGRACLDPAGKTRRWLTAAAMVAAGVGAWSGVHAQTPHQRSAASLTSTLRTEFVISQADKKVGSEIIEKKTFDNNTVVFTIDARMTYGEGVEMNQHVELVLEDESFFPRTLTVKKTVTQGDKGTFDHELSVEMFSNLAVVSSMVGKQADSRRIVVPTGVAITDAGILGYLYQTLFWYDRQLGGKQRFEYLDPISVSVQSGEMNADSEATIPVMGKKTKTTVFKLDREKLGPATLWLDKDGTIVKGEQNYFTYELVNKTNS